MHSCGQDKADQLLFSGRKVRLAEQLWFDFCGASLVPIVLMVSFNFSKKHVDFSGNLIRYQAHTLLL